MIGYDARPAAVKNFLANTIKSLGRTSKQVGMMDPKVPIEDTIGTILTWSKAGYVRAIDIGTRGRHDRRAQATSHQHLQIGSPLLAEAGSKACCHLHELGIDNTAYGFAPPGSSRSGPGPQEPDGRAMRPRCRATICKQSGVISATPSRRPAARESTASALRSRESLANGKSIVPVSARENEPNARILSAPYPFNSRMKRFRESKALCRRMPSPAHDMTRTK